MQEEEKQEEKTSDKIKQKKFTKAFRNHFLHENAVQRLVEVAKETFGLKIPRHQAKKLFFEFLDNKTFRNKEDFLSASDEEIAKRISNFINEHNGEE